MVGDSAIVTPPIGLFWPTPTVAVAGAEIEGVPEPALTLTVLLAVLLDATPSVTVQSIVRLSSVPLNVGSEPPP